MPSLAIEKPVTIATKAQPGAKSRRGPVALAIGCWLYALALLALWATVATQSDRWWPATVLMFSPHWLWATPLLILIPAAAVWRRRLLVLLAGIMLLALGPVMSFCLPWSRFQADDPSAFRVRVLTCNAHRGELKPDDLGLFIAQTMPDIVAIQDWTSKYEQKVFWQQDWQIRRVDEICLASRFPIAKVQDLAGEESSDHGTLVGYELETPVGPLHLLNLHLSSPHVGLEGVIDLSSRGIAELEANSEQRRRQSELAQEWAQSISGPMLVAGDFNTPPDSTIYRDNWSDYSNAFSQAGFGWGHTYFTRKTSIRIDNLLAGPGWRCRRCFVGPDVGSPHRPLVSDWELSVSIKP
jgi:vancomycin resistance protein VanJ